jgi:hypothetical protein
MCVLNIDGINKKKVGNTDSPPLANAKYLMIFIDDFFLVYFNIFVEE